MQHPYFLEIENYVSSTELDLQDVLANLNYDDRGLIPVITQDSESKEVLMLAWMNQEALNNTLTTGRVTYWSRSRQELWIKGETSGHIQELVSLNIDCDGDAILCLARQTGAACHTGRKHCFYLQADNQKQKVYVR